MEAKDTVLKANETPNFFVDIHELLSQQAEITWGIAYKAGARKVVGWIEKNSSEANRYYHSMLFPSLYFETAKWQAFKKEHGLEVKE